MAGPRWARRPSPVFWRERWRRPGRGSSQGHLRLPAILPLLHPRASAMSPQKRRRWGPLLLLSALFAASAIPLAAVSPSSYADHCGAVVTESAADSTTSYSNVPLELRNGYFYGGDRILGRDDNSSFSIRRSLRFNPWQLYGTQKRGIVGVKGSLVLRGGSIFAVRRNFTRGRGLFRVVRPRGPTAVRRRGGASFDMAGFWSEATGKLCMVGSGVATSREGKALSLSAVFKLNYPKTTNITNSLATGTVECLDSPASPNFFDPISLLAYSHHTYEYTLIPQAEELSALGVAEERALGLGATDSLCLILSSFPGGARLFYGTDCHGRNCSPLGGTGDSLPSFLSLQEVQCLEGGKLHMYMVFSDSDRFRHSTVVRPEKILVGEGFWDHARKHLSLVACQVLNYKDSLEGAFVGACTTGLRFWFPEVLSIENRSPLVGRIWSNRSSTDPGYFEMITVRSVEGQLPISGVKYEYTKVDLARKSCGENKTGDSHAREYPHGKSITDLRFDVQLSNSEGESVWAFANPVSIGNTLYSYNFAGSNGSFLSDTFVETNQSLWNISYKIASGFYNVSSGINTLNDISAEGIYNEDTGKLCLVGCRYIAHTDGEKHRKQTNLTDCEILINVQLSPLNPEAGEHLSGKLRSQRHESDPLYFKPFELSSNIMYVEQAAESIWRMDVEITMVLISLTLSCVFIGLQLFYVKRHPDVLPSTSIGMLVVLTLGHMIPLVLNFEALFVMNRNRQNVLLWSGGWLEANEVIVRLITMVAFLLQFRFLQLAWSARSSGDAKTGLWVAERKALQFCLPLYFIGLLIAWFVKERSYDTPILRSSIITEPQTSIWEGLISYAGLVLDGFLLPQILLNIFWNSKEKVLLPAFYGGMTIVRALPHIYDAYRAHHYVPHINSSYIYASPEWDLYSSAWDIIIPCEGLLFAIIIFLQQRFGGNWILPPRFRNPRGYETVPVVSG